jgi:putative ABC transport system substrate-binding protein
VRRRGFIAGIASAAVVPPLAAAAQQSDRQRLIGVLMGFAESDQFSQSLVAQLQDTLAKLGWKDGANLRIEVRWGAGDAERIAALAKELVELRPDAILGQTTPVAKALARETRTIPIVFVTVSDPIGGGLAASLARPGGNVTGFTFVEHDTGGKWVELLKEIAPQTIRAALLFNPTTAPPLEFYLPSIKSAAASFGIETFVTPVSDKDEIEGVISAQARDPGGGIIVMPDAFNTTNQHLIVALTARYRVPAIYGNNFADAGGLIYYGANFLESFRLAAGYVDRVLKGTKPEELPIQLPAKFELVINLKTAKALGLTVPQSLIATADEVIE